MSWDRKQGTRGLSPLTTHGIVERCPVPFDLGAPIHWGGAWDVEFTGGPPGVSCNFCHKTWWARGNVYVPTWQPLPQPPEET